MTEYIVTWTQCPTAYNPVQVLYVTAGNEADAKTLAGDHIQRQYGVGRFVISEIQPAPAMPAGRVHGAQPARAVPAQCGARLEDADHVVCREPAGHAGAHGDGRRRWSA
jgi:hypothetical protein